VFTNEGFSGVLKSGLRWHVWSNIEHSSFTEPVMVVYSVFFSVGAYSVPFAGNAVIMLSRATIFVFVCVCASTVRLMYLYFCCKRWNTCWMLRPIKVNKIIAHQYAFLWSEENSNDYMHCYSYYISTYHTHTIWFWFFNGDIP